MTEATIADFTRSLFASLNVPGLDNKLQVAENPSQRECLLLIDGLGARQLAQFADFAPNISSMSRERELVTSFPSTTATSLASLGTGLLSGAHGMLGYTVRVPHSGTPGRLLNALKWDSRVDPVVWQSAPTLFERAKESGMSVYNIAATKFARSGLTEAALRGAKYVGTESFSAQVNGAARALKYENSFAYVYLNDLDVAGHRFGVGSEQWIAALSIVDDVAGRLSEGLPPGSRLWITGDHGMLNANEWIVLGIDNDLMQDVALVGGEPRARHIYVAEGAAADVCDRWRATLGAKAKIFLKDEAIQAGLFGSLVSAAACDRIGDVVAIGLEALVLIDPSRSAKESAIVGHHGGLSEAERIVPLYVHV
ncbi:MAG TPA: alkaline phosphatase family protein [Candidatus Nanopelagicaceae bacterium]|nr:alkaline phosphatase family protein [Candidatus Nanopelagicaceae bacterium]